LASSNIVMPNDQMSADELYLHGNTTAETCHRCSFWPARITAQHPSTQERQRRCCYSLCSACHSLLSSPQSCAHSACSDVMDKHNSLMLPAGAIHAAQARGVQWHCLPACKCCCPACCLAMCSGHT
jgi:hypothetical protein